jgi:putative NADH-flavin reductase
MRITVFGATGGIGHEVVRQALDAGHEITAVVRDPARLRVAPHERLRVVTVTDVTDAAAVTPAIANADAVISTLGPANLKQAKTAPIAEPALRAITAAMDATGVRRVLAVSAAPVGPPVTGDGLVMRAIAFPLLRTLLKAVYADLAAMERTMAASGTEWTVVRPPRLTHGPHTGRYRTAIGANVSHGRTISRADVADAMLVGLADERLTRQAVGLAY